MMKRHASHVMVAQYSSTRGKADLVVKYQKHLILQESQKDTHSLCPSIELRMKAAISLPSSSSRKHITMRLTRRPELQTKRSLAKRGPCHYSIRVPTRTTRCSSRSRGSTSSCIAASSPATTCSTPTARLTQCTLSRSNTPCHAASIWDIQTRPWYLRQ